MKNYAQKEKRTEEKQGRKKSDCWISLPANVVYIYYMYIGKLQAVSSKLETEGKKKSVYFTFKKNVEVIL